LPIEKQSNEKDMLRKYKSIPVIKTVQACGLLAAASSYIRKPVDFDQFSGAVREMGPYWLRLNELQARNS
jgi:hypothetical protein